MSIIIPPPPGPTRLARKALGFGGLDMSRAVAAAQSRLEEHRDAAMGELDVLLDDLRSAHARLIAGDPAAARRMHALADAMPGVAGCFLSPEMTSAAYGLCSLLDRLAEGETINPEALRVHVDALRLLRSSSDPRVHAVLAAELAAVSKR